MNRARYVRLPIARFIPRSMRPDEFPDVRRLWWQLRRHEGAELPAEPGVIVLTGGRR